MEFKELKNRIHEYQEKGKKYFTTFSFQTHSLVLLHMLSRIDKDIPVVFINTGFHFPKTISFRDKVMAEFGLTNLIDLQSQTPKSNQRGPEGRLLFASNPDFCCFLNKTEPLNKLLYSYDVWINGVRADQSATRKAMKVDQPASNRTMRFHPMLDWNSKMIYEYRREFNLPEHPMDAEGYMSIGCEPCTRRIDPSMSDREARWFGLNKTECGLHTDLIEK